MSWAEANTRAAIFQAMTERRVFATTGQRPDLRFSIGDIPMGGCGRVDGTPVLSVQVQCEVPVQSIRIIRDGDNHPSTGLRFPDGRTRVAGCDRE